MKLRFYPNWEVDNLSKKEIAIQEDDTSVSVISPINNYAFGILSEAHFVVQNQQIIDVNIEHHSEEIEMTANQESHIIMIRDIT
ncbi:hypothetical protein HCH16_02235 [Staphylococcus pettenkoferi]|uniref:hypothetical protein n=1 Tax=Staphylococcus pettenkoferi TaxID=170573 RepID=UPI001C8B3D66|nr:hypothetical protein [Staphylococcus pettenkoferi]MBX8992740.1 hypothetical protein [Staphylococcus pettenkoferi]